MKKKLIFLISIIVIILLLFGLYSHYIDSARVRNNVEPKFTIKIVDDDSNKITYWGFGYKVIRYVDVSTNEPYENNIGVKYGSWFMKYNIRKDLNQDKNISMTIKEGTLTNTGATIIITDTTGKDNVYGNWYRIDKKENGIWQELDIIFEGNYGCNLIGYSPNENNQLEMDVNWEDLYGKLESGEYRLVKETSIPLENQKYYFSVEFVLK